MQRVFVWGVLGRFDLLVSRELGLRITQKKVPWGWGVAWAEVCREIEAFFYICDRKEWGFVLFRFSNFKRKE